ncbi:Glucose-6-phosphate isomerase, cytosolic [Spatholobus suberectus]|nr:Glucose-6-phosphate isomerase, cytosolic [Spatholobus suberectus]
MASIALFSDTQPWKDLKQAYVEDIKKTYLCDLLSDDKRCQSMLVDLDDILLDYSRQQATPETIQKLFQLAKAASLKEKINCMYSREHINSTENRLVLYVALHASRDAIIQSDGKHVLEVWKVVDKIQEFFKRVHNGSWIGTTRKALKDVVAIGIGGSFLGPLFVHTALQTGRLANVDLIDVARNITGLNLETTLVVVVSKTFTTIETMLNARTLREWVSSALGAIGVLSLPLQYGFSVIKKFLKGPSSIDQHFYSQPFERNIPVLQGLLSIWNVSFLGYLARGILPYSQALDKVCPTHSTGNMESNGKGVSIDGVPIPFEAGEIDFAELGTNGQHNFYQLIHQGRVIPCDFIGVVKSQQPVFLKGEVVSNHDELMSNYFTQPDALAYRKIANQLQKENVSLHLIPHKTFNGNRHSLSLLLPSLNAYNIGQVYANYFIGPDFLALYVTQLMAIYEHKIVVEGFIWGINSFDQWGVEPGKHTLVSHICCGFGKGPGDRVLCGEGCGCGQYDLVVA